MLVATGATTASVAGAFDSETAPPPWSSRCAIKIRAHEDGSASLYCKGRRRAFGGVDAESGRIRFFIPH